jgi:YggT family protein
MAVIASLVNFLCWVLIVLIFVRVAFTWISRDYRNPIFRYSYQLTEPLLRPVRNLLPGAGVGGLDFSPTIVMVGLMVVSQVVSSLA